MIAQFEVFLTAILGNASVIGAVSWVHALTWFAALLVAIYEPPCVYRRVKLSKGRPYETGKTHPYI